MHSALQLTGGTGLLAAGVSMMCLEHIRNRAGRPFLKSEALAIPYWLLYLTFAVLGVVLMISAIVH